MADLTHALPGALAQPARVTAVSRDTAIDTMRGLAILMVIGIHALQQPLTAPWQIGVDAALRPCVPIFLFASGYLTGLSGRVPLGKRTTAALIPYTIAFVAAYAYMASQNPAMDHRVTTTIARFVLAYVFVYYYVFVYVGCTICLWAVLWIARLTAAESDRRLAILLISSIVTGLIAGSYIDPLLMHRGLSDGLIEEVRMRDIPFWFGFAALGMLVARSGIVPVLREMRLTWATMTLIAYAIYAGIRIYGIGDAADYDSAAFFGYAAALCILLLACDIRLPFLAVLGSGSYFIYLWHIFIIMALRDHGGLRPLGAAVASLTTYAATVAVICLALLAIQRWAPPRAARWLGA